jgi:methionyl-tRNA formyltransferase
MVIAAYGLILPQAVLDIAPYGAINIHASLLPRWRGAAPIARAIEAGDAESGIAIMKMVAGLDMGPVLLERRVPISETDTTGSLTDRLAQVGAEAITRVLEALDSLVPVFQDDAKATYASKVTKLEARIDWSRSSLVVGRLVRALNPAPGAETAAAGVTLKVWEGFPCAGVGSPGTVLSANRDSVTIACGEQALAISSLQRAGGRRLSAGEFLKGFPLPVGTVLGSPA